MTDPRLDPSHDLMVRDPPGSPVQILAAHLITHHHRLRESLKAVQRHAVALTPSHQLRTSPIAWAVGAATLGFLLGLLTAPRR